MAHDDNEIHEFCKEKFRQYDEHCKDGKEFRDKAIIHDRDIKTLFNALRDLGDLRKTIIGASASIIFTLVLASITLAASWGRTLATVERLDQMHRGQEAYDSTRQNSQKSTRVL